jgi:hypothetical protein
MPRAIYPSDITREQFEVIRPQLDNFKKPPSRELLMSSMFFVQLSMPRTPYSAIRCLIKFRFLPLASTWFAVYFQALRLGYRIKILIPQLQLAVASYRVLR